MKIFIISIFTCLMMIGCENSSKQDYSDYHYDIQGVWTLVKVKPEGSDEWNYVTQGRESIVTDKKIKRHNSKTKYDYEVLNKGTILTNDYILGDTVSIIVTENEATWIFQGGTIWKLTK